MRARVPLKVADRYFEALSEYRMKQRRANAAQGKLRLAERLVRDAVRRKP